MTELGARRASARPARQVAIEVLNGAGRAVCVEFTIRAHVVEVWTAGRCSAVVERPALHDWLGDLGGGRDVLDLDDLVWVRTPTGVTLRLANVFPSWELAPRDLMRLREQV